MMLQMREVSFCWSETLSETANDDDVIPPPLHPSSSTARIGILSSLSHSLQVQTDLFPPTEAALPVDKKYPNPNHPSTVLPASDSDSESQGFDSLHAYGFIQNFND